MYADKRITDDGHRIEAHRSRALPTAAIVVAIGSGLIAASSFADGRTLRASANVLMVLGMLLLAAGLLLSLRIDERGVRLGGEPRTVPWNQVTEFRQSAGQQLEVVRVGGKHQVIGLPVEYLDRLEELRHRYQSG